MANKKLIIFTDSGDTIIDEGTQVYDDRGIVLEADFIPGAGEVLKQLHDEGFTIALVADGEWESFQNVYRKNGLGYCFDAWVVSEVVGLQKPAPIMFETAYEKLGLTDADKMVTKRCAKHNFIALNSAQDLTCHLLGLQDRQKT